MKYYNKKFTIILAALTINFLMIQPIMGQESEAIKQFEYAQRLADDGLFDLAVEQFDEFLRLFPDSPNAPAALFLMGENLARIGSWKESSAQFRRLLIKYPDFRRCDEALYRTYENLVRLGDLDGAITGFERFGLFYPQSPLAPRSLLRAGDLRFGKMQFFHAEENWLRMVEDYPGSNVIHQVRHRLARLYLKLHKPANAQAQIDRLLDKSPSGDELAAIGLLKARILTAQFRLDQAETLYDKLMREKLSPEWQRRVKLAYSEHKLSAGNFDESKAILEPLLSMETTASLQDSTLLMWSRVMAKGGNGKSFVETVSKLVENKADSAILVSAFDIGLDVLNKQEDVQANIRLLRLYLDLEKRTAVDSLKLKSAYEMLLESYREAGQIADAVRIGEVALNRFIHDDAFSDRIQYALGLIHLKDLKQPRNALFFFERILAPSRFSALEDDAAYGEALCYEEMGNIERATELFDHFIDSYPGSPHVSQADGKLRYYRDYVADDASIELMRMSALFSNLLLKAEREKTILGLIEQMFYNLKAYQQVIDMAKLADQQGLLADHKTRLYQMVGESYYRLARRDGISKVDSELLEKSRENLVKYLASGISSGEELRVALILREIDWMRSKEKPAGLQSEYKLTKVLLNKYGREQAATELRLELAEILMKMGEQTPDSIASAIKIYDHIVTDGGAVASSNGSPGDPASRSVEFEKALYGRATAYLTIGDTIRALDDFATYLNQFSSRGRFMLSVLLKSGELNLELGKLEEARSCFQQLVSKFYYSPDVYGAMLTLARIKIDQGDFSQALDLLGEVRGNLYDESQTVLYLEGLAHLGMKNHLHARRSFMEYMRKYSEGKHIADVYLQLAELAKIANQDQESRLNYERFINRFPGDSRSHQIRIELADQRFQQGDFSGALDQYRNLAQTIATGIERRILDRKIVICNIKIGDVAAAQRLRADFSKKYDDTDLDLAAIDYELGNYYLEQKYFEGAEKVFKEIASEHRRTRYGPYGSYGLGKLRMITNKTEEALEILTRIIQDSPNTEIMPNVLLTLGEFYYNNKQPENALSAFERCIELQPDRQLDMVARRQLINLYSQLGFYEAGIQSIRNFIAKYPEAESAFAYQIKLGVNLMALNEYDRAIDHFRSLIPKANNDEAAEIRYQIGQSYYEMGQFRRAISEFLKVNYLTLPTKLPWHVTAQYQSGEAYLKLKEWDKAEQLFSKIVEKEGPASDFGRVATAKLREIEKIKKDRF